MQPNWPSLMNDLLKVSNFQNENKKWSHCPKFLFISWAMRYLHIFFLKFTDLYINFHFAGFSKNNCQPNFHVPYFRE